VNINLDPTGIPTVSTAFANIIQAITHACEVNRVTMSQASRDEYDRIQAQMYWDWRTFLQRINLVDPISQTPPKA
jgi:hypothetical protein